MKPKRFVDELWPIALFGVLFFFAGSLAFFGVFIALLFPPYEGYSVLHVFFAESVFLAGAIGLLFAANYANWYDRAFGRLLVYNDRIVLKRFLRKRITLKIEECQYVGIEDYSLLNKGMPVIRGDEISFIYLSTKPYPQKYSGKITCVKNKRGFIKMHFSTKLAEALLEVLPRSQTCQLYSFYWKIKLNEKAMEDRQKRKKEKRKKKK